MYEYTPNNSTLLFATLLCLGATSSKRNQGVLLYSMFLFSRFLSNISFFAFDGQHLVKRLQYHFPPALSLVIVELSKFDSSGLSLVFHHAQKTRGGPDSEITTHPKEIASTDSFCLSSTLPVADGAKFSFLGSLVALHTRTSSPTMTLRKTQETMAYKAESSRSLSTTEANTNKSNNSKWPADVGTAAAAEAALVGAVAVVAADAA